MKLKRRQVSKVAPGTFIEQLRSGSRKRATNRRRGDWKVAEGRGMEGSATLGGLGFCPQLYFNARRNAKRKKRTSSSRWKASIQNSFLPLKLAVSIYRATVSIFSDVNPIFFNRVEGRACFKFIACIPKCVSLFLRGNFNFSNGKRNNIEIKERAIYRNSHQVSKFRF